MPDIGDCDIIKKGYTYRHLNGEALYPFEYGLTYTYFAYSRLKVALAQKDAVRQEEHVREISDSPVTLEIVLTGNGKLRWFRTADNQQHKGGRKKWKENGQI